jgi:hypothetical protein
MRKMLLIIGILLAAALAAALFAGPNMARLIGASAGQREHTKPSQPGSLAIDARFAHMQNG